MASAAEIANDMAARAPFWRGRDTKVERTCREAATIIRAFVAGNQIDGRAVSGLLVRLDNLAQRNRDATGIAASADRAAECIRALRAEKAA